MHKLKTYTTVVLFTLFCQSIFGISIDKKIGIYLSDISYEEPAFMSENGSMIGMLGSYGIYGDYMLKFEANYAEGFIDYVGSGSFEAYDHIIELRELGGINYVLENGTNLIPFIGLGYRYLNDDSTNTISTTGASGYEREQSYIYIPIGFEYKQPAKKNGWQINSNLEYDLFLQGTNHTNLGSIPGYYDITLNQFKGYGYRISLQFINKNKEKTYITEPFYKHWHIDTSDNTIDPNGISFVEPENTSDEIGISFIWLLKSM